MHCVLQIVVWTVFVLRSKHRSADLKMEETHLDLVNVTLKRAALGFAVSVAAYACFRLYQRKQIESDQFIPPG